MKQLLKKSITICVTMIFLLSAMIMNVSAEESVVTYGIEYTDTTATVTLYMKEISSFDIAIAYDPAKLTVADCGYSTAFKMLQRDGNMTISVMNEDALDEKGNTYMVFTGAGTNQTTGGAIDFAGNPLATVTFEGDLANSVITIVTDSASADDIYTANKIAEVSLNQSSGVVITPEPVEGVEYKEDTVTESPDETTESSTGSQEPATSDSDSESGNSDGTGTSNTATEDTDAIVETEIVEDDSDNDSDAEADKESNNTDSAAEKDIAQEDEESTRDIMLYVLIGVAVLMIIIVAVLAIKKKKTAVK